MRSSRLATLALTSMFVGYACLGASAHRNISTRTTSDDVRGCGDLRWSSTANRRPRRRKPSPYLRAPATP